MAHASMIGCDVGHGKEVGGILMYVYIYSYGCPNGPLSYIGTCVYDVSMNAVYIYDQ